MMHAPALELTQSEQSTRKIKTQKSLLWLGIVSITMLFAAFTSAYIVRQGEGKWLVFDLPNMFIASTVVIVLSSGDVRAAYETSAEIDSMGNVAGSFLYVITALHVLHLAAGLLVLAVVFYRALRGRYSSAHYNGVSLCATYWHFLDGLWVYLFFFLLYIR